MKSHPIPVNSVKLFSMKKTFRLLALTMLVLMLRYTLLPHQFMAYASCEEVVTGSDLNLNTPEKHRDMEQVFVVDHPEQYLLSQFVMSDYLPDYAIAPIRLGVAEPVPVPRRVITKESPHRGPPRSASLPIHMDSTRLLI